MSVATSTGTRPALNSESARVRAGWLFPQIGHGDANRLEAVLRRNQVFDVVVLILGGRVLVVAGKLLVSGRVFDSEGKPLRNTLVEIWQANAAGRYRHKWDQWPAPLDPNFSGAGR